MACKSCKKSKEVKNRLDSSVDSVQSLINDRKLEILNKTNPEHLKPLPIEKILVVILGWIPLVIGYISIIRYIISIL